MKRPSLKRIFIFILLFAGIIPSLISIMFVVNQLKLNEKQQKLINEKLQKNIFYSINSEISLIENKIEMLIDSSELIDYFRTPNEFKNLIENRLYGKGKIFIEQSSLPFNLMIQDNSNKHLLSIGETHAGDLVLFEKEVRLNDLNMPDGMLYGSVKVLLNPLNIYSKYPLVKEIMINSSNNKFISLQFKEIEKTRSTVLLLIISIFTLILSAAIGFLLLQKQVFSPIQNLTGKLLTNESKIGKIKSNNEIEYLEQVTKNYVELTRKKEIQQISAQVAHDIRSPLIALKNYLTKNDIDKEIAFKALNRIEEIAAKLGNKRFNSQKTLFSPERIIIDLIKEYSLHSKAKISLKSNINSKLDTNMSEFCAAISNIIDNSIDATKKPEIEISLTSRKNQLFISLKDNGPGMPNSDLIFKEGYTTKETGSGLGLFQVKRFMDSIDGNVSAIVDQSGTTILLTFNQVMKDTIIILDDDELYLKVSQIRLKQLGYQSILFSDKMKLYGFLENNKKKYDLYIDKNIEKEGDGLQVKEALKNRSNLNIYMNSSSLPEGKRDWS